MTMDDDSGAREDDEALIDSARRGDVSALMALLERHRPELEDFAARTLPARVRRRVSVADVLQEAHIAAVSRCRDFESRGPNSFRNWLYRIVQHKVRDAVRHHEGSEKRSLRREVSRAARRATEHHVGRSPTPSQVAVGAETAHLARRALESLRPDDRMILRLTREEGLSLDEAAERMGRSPEAARKLLSRALDRFAEELDRLRGEPRGR